MENLNDTSNAPVALTAHASRRIKVFQSRETPAKMFRISVTAGGCSGFQYDFGFDEKKEDDILIKSQGTPFIVNEQSLPYLKGCTVDFKDDLKGTGFIVTNPNAKGTCGCGVSFAV